MKAIRPSRPALAMLLAAMLLLGAAAAQADPAPAVDYSTVPYVSITLGETDQPQGLTLVQGVPDGQTTRQLVDGQTLVQANPQGDKMGWFPLAVDDHYLYTGISTAVVLITYYDVGLTPIYLEYDAYDPNQEDQSVVQPKRVLLASRRNSGSWANAQVELPDAWFGNRLQGGADLRIGSSSPLVLRAVLVQRMGVTERPVRVLLDGQRMHFDARPQLIGGHVMVPLRDLLGALGAQITWAPAAQMVQAMRGERRLQLTVGQNVAYVDDKPVPIDAPPVIVPPGRVLVPLRFINEALGARVQWDPATYTVTITSPSPAANAPVDGTSP